MVWAAVSISVPLALAMGLRLWRADVARKWWFAGAVGALSLLVYALTWSGALGPYYSFLVTTKGSSAFFLRLLLVGGVLPGVAVLSEVRWGPPRGPRAVEPVRGRFLRFLTLSAGLFLPLIAFALSEAELGPGEGPLWARPHVATWWALTLVPEAQRPFYPLLAWSMLALLASSQRLRGPWISTGLLGGVVLSFLSCLLYVRVLPLAAIMLVVGIGLAGFAPHMAFVCYSNAAHRDRAECGGQRWLGWAWPTTWVTAFAFASWFMARKAVELHAKLPTTPPQDCYIASAAARGSWVAAPRVLFANGETAPVSRQLRVFKLGELLLADAWPGVHRGLRAVYDRLGPPLARRMGPVSGSLAYLLLLPPQWVVETSLWLLRVDPSLLHRVYPSPLLSPLRIPANVPCTFDPPAANSHRSPSDEGPEDWERRT
jgi:hypothetical protein